MSFPTVVRRSFLECCELMEERLAAAQRDFSKRMRNQHASSMGYTRSEVPSNLNGLNRNAANLLAVMEHSSSLHDSLHSIRVPRAEIHHSVPDFPPFLLTRVRKQSGKRFNASVSDERIINEFTEWLDMYSPLVSSNTYTETQNGLHHPMSMESDTISALALLNYMDSFCRYHNGVMWDRDHNGGYVIHPWHFQYSPQHRCEQMPYVHMLQWLNANGGVWKGNGSSIGQQSLLLNTAASSSSNNSGPSALDLTCQSGFTADLLLKSGVKRVLCADRDEWALANCEATVREHMREKRSGGLAKDKLVSFIHCDVLPDVQTLLDELQQTQGERESIDSRSGPSLKLHSAVNATAARRRRAQGRTYARFDSESSNGSSSQQSKEETISKRREIARQLEIQSRFDLLCFHPPMNSFILGSPLDSYHHMVDRQTRMTGESERMLAGILSALVGSANYADGGKLNGAALSYPLLNDESVAAFVVPRSFNVLDGSSSANNTGLTDIILSRIEQEEGGSSFDVLLHRPHSLFPLAEEVSGLKSLLRKSMYPSSIPSRQRSSNKMSFPWLNTSNHNSSSGGGGCVSTANPFSTIPMLLDASVCPEFIQSVSEGIIQHYEEQSVDLLIVKRRQRKSFAGCEVIRKHQIGTVNPTTTTSPLSSRKVVASEESFVDTLEYNEYLPRDGPSNPFHWFAQVPSYSYLEHGSDSTKEKKENQPNLNSSLSPESSSASDVSPGSVLTSGYEGLQHTMQVRYAASNGIHSDQSTSIYSKEGGRSIVSPAQSALVANAGAYRDASQRFNTLFHPEMRRMRQKRMRRMATESPGKQDWYLDEKFVKSSAAQLELMNELMKFDFREPE